MIFEKNIKVNKRSIKRNSPIYIVAEMACAHDGNVNKAKKLVRAAKNANANCVQLEIFEPDLTCIPGTEENLELHSIYFTRKEWASIINYCKKIKISVSVFAYDPKSLEFAIDQKVDLIKFNSSDLGNVEMLDILCKTKIPATLGTGSSTLEEINLTLDYLFRRGKKNIIIVHGVQNFPTDPKYERISKLDILSKNFNVLIGYANHTAGENKFSQFIDFVAIGKDICLLEKHITVNRKEKGIDYFSSLEPEEFKNYVKNIRFAEETLGHKYGMNLIKPDLTYRVFQKKSIVAKYDLKRNHKIKKNDLIFIRHMKKQGISPIKYRKILGKKLKKAVKKNELIPLSTL